jgi:hypothetical protein
MSRVASRTHVQSSGYPIQRHRRFISQSFGYFYFFRVPFALCRQVLQPPAPPLEFFGQQSLG